MGQIKVTTCDIEGLKVIEPKVFREMREDIFSSHTIIMITFQINHRRINWFESGKWRSV